MSIKITKTIGPIEHKELQCDGPKHKGDTHILYNTVTVEFGFGDYLDGSVIHFCGRTCLNDWIKQE